jgi:hypothetical protein
MGSQKDVRKSYAEAMAKFGTIGHAIYEPISTKAMKLAQFGFFDDQKTWNPIGTVIEPPDGMATFDNSKLKPVFVDDHISWGERTSSNVSMHKMDIDVGAT